MTTLDDYLIATQQPEGMRPVVVLVCERRHRDGAAWAGITARDIAGDQTGLTLGELIEQAEQHEAEQHTEEASDR